MSSPNPPRRRAVRTALPAALFALASVVAPACGGATAGPGSATQRVIPDHPCGVEGAHADSVDGCNTCACSTGSWACTERACPATDAGTWPCTADSCPPRPVCKGGDTLGSGGCGCWCQSGDWVCSGVCPPPIDAGRAIDAGPAPKGCGGWLGDTCTATEYCAYEVGQMCGASDASATCQPRPQGCTAQYDPVCGCDGRTYGNGCAAAMAGTGVNHAGTCL